MTDWKPIETAPRDATSILGYWSGSLIYGVVSNRGGFLWEYEDSEVSPPSHWMSLPEPPDVPDA